MKDKVLFYGIEIKVWAVACFAQQGMCNEEALRKFSLHLMKTSTETGMPIRSQPCFCKYAKSVDDVSILDVSCQLALTNYIPACFCYIIRNLSSFIFFKKTS